jgi:hypothetical protein
VCIERRLPLVEESAEWLLRLIATLCFDGDRRRADLPVSVDDDAAVPAACGEHRAVRVPAAQARKILGTTRANTVTGDDSWWSHQSHHHHQCSKTASAHSTWREHHHGDSNIIIVRERT